MWTLAARHPRATLAVFAGLLVAASLGALQLRPTVDFVDTVPASPDVDAYRHLLDKLDGTRFVAVYLPAADGVSLRDDASFDRLVLEQQDLTAFLEARFPDAFSHTLSVYEAMRAGNYMFQKVATAGNAPDDAYSLPADPVSQQYVRDQVRGPDGDDVLAQNGQSAIALFFIASHDDGAARDLAGNVAAALKDWDRDHGNRVTGTPQASGLAYTSHVTDERTQEDMRVWGLVAAGATALVLIVVVRRVGDLVSAAVALTLATTAAFGLVGWAGLRVSFLTVFLAPIVTGIGMDQALHVLHRNAEARRHGEPRAAALAHALRDVGPAVGVSGLTTAAGLAVLLWVDAPLFAQVGLLGAIGVVLGLVASLTVAPALRALLPERQPHLRKDRIGSAIAAFGMGVRRNRVLAILGVVALLAGGAVGALQVTTGSGSSQNEFPQDDPAIVLQHRVETEYGAFQRAYLVVEGDIAQPGILRALHEATARSADLPLWRSSSSISDLLLADARTDQGALDIALGIVTTPSDDDLLPKSGGAAIVALDKLFEDPLWHSVAPFTIARDYSLAVVAIQVHPWQDADQLALLADRLQEEAAALQDAAGPAYQVHAAGAPLNREAVAKSIPQDVRLATFGVAVVVLAGLLLGGLLRGVGGLLSALVGLVIVLGAALLLLASIPALDGIYQAAADDGAAHNTAELSQMFLLAFAVTVAVGVDGHIQLVHRAWTHRDEGATPEEATRRALRDVGRAVTGTALTTVAAFAPLAGLYFLQSKNLAILTAAGAVYAFLLTLLLTPLCMGIGRRRANSSRSS